LEYGKEKSDSSLLHTPQLQDQQERSGEVERFWGGDRKGGRVGVKIGGHILSSGSDTKHRGEKVKRTVYPIRSERGGRNPFFRTKPE